MLFSVVGKVVFNHSNACTARNSSCYLLGFRSSVGSTPPVLLTFFLLMRTSHLLFLFCLLTLPPPFFSITASLTNANIYLARCCCFCLFVCFFDVSFCVIWFTDSFVLSSFFFSAYLPLPLICCCCFHYFLLFG